VSWPRSEIAKGISIFYQYLVTPISLGYSLSVFNNNSTLIKMVLRIFGDLSVTIAQWLRARHIRNLVICKVPGSIPAENTSPQIHMDLST